MGTKWTIRPHDKQLLTYWRYNVTYMYTHMYIYRHESITPKRVGVTSMIKGRIFPALTATIV